MHRLIENLDTEFKSCENGVLPDSLWQHMSAFANTRGGKVLLGVSDDGQEIELSREILDKLQKDVSTLISNDKFNRPISVNIECNGA
ncbi:ATP-binding protein [Candidatus Saccharibacteria bacterium]|nr:MAG: ATP-binding protein [Candidatus Saccharibacteria bacterium]